MLESIKNRKSGIITAMITILISLGSLLIVSWICSMAFSNACVELEEQYLSTQGKEMIEEIENSVNFGKDISHYYGMEELLLKISRHPYETVKAVILNPQGELLYSTFTKGDGKEEVLAKILSKPQREIFAGLMDEKEWKSLEILYENALVYPINRKNKEHIGNLMLVYNTKNFSEDGGVYYGILPVIWLIASLLLFLFYFFIPVTKTGKWYIRLFPLMIIMAALLLYMQSMFGVYREKYDSLVKEKASQEAERINSSLEDLEEKGFPMERIGDLSGYLDKKTQALDAIGSIEVVLPYYSSIDTIETAENSSLKFPIRGSSLVLDVQPSQSYLDKKVQNMTLVFAAIFIICLMVTYELNSLSAVIKARLEDRRQNNDLHKRENPGVNDRQYEGITAQIRLISFFSYTAIYLSMPYAAVIMKEWGARVFGLTEEISASLPLMVELFCITLASMLIQKFFRGAKLSRIGIFVYVFLFLGNLASAFAASPYILIGLRAFCGIGFAFLKYWLNGIIAAGSKDEKGTGANISNLNAGLLGGITVGGALGAIFAEALGYQSNYYFTALSALALLAITYLCLPFSFLNQSRRETALLASQRPAGAAGILKDRQVLKVLIFGCIPLNAGLMYVVAFLPVYMNHVGQSALAISYAYLINGLSGVYLGVLMAALLQKLPGRITAGITMLLGAAGILILVIGRGIGVIFVSSAVMGLFDGYGSPGVIQHFTGLKAIRGKDMAGALTLFNSVGGGIQILCPMLYNILIQPDGGVIYLTVFGCGYIGIALFFFLMGGSKRTVSTS